MHKVAQRAQQAQEGAEPHARRDLICPPGERHTCFVPNCSLPHPSLHPPPSVGRVKTDGRFLNGMQQLAPKPNSFPPHPTARTEPHELQNRLTKPQFGEHHAASTALFLVCPPAQHDPCLVLLGMAGHLLPPQHRLAAGVQSSRAVQSAELPHTTAGLGIFIGDRAAELHSTTGPLCKAAEPCPRESSAQTQVPEDRKGHAAATAHLALASLLPAQGRRQAAPRCYTAVMALPSKPGTL